MISTSKRVLLLHLGGQTIRTTADHPFFVSGRGWTRASDLRLGDPLRTHDGQDVPLDAITDHGEDLVVYELEAGVSPFPCTGLWPAGTLLETADGPRPIEEVKPGDYLVVRPPPDPERN